MSEIISKIHDPFLKNSPTTASDRNTDTALPLPYSSIAIFCLGFLILLCWYWRMDFYYYFLDDAVMLNNFRHNGWGEVWKAQNEHFMPLYKFVLYSYAKLFGNNGYWLHVVTVLAHGVVVFIAAYLAYVISRSWFLAAFALVLYGLNPLIWETLYLQGGFGAALVLMGWLGSVLCLFLWFQYRLRYLLILSLALLVFQSYTGGNSLFYPSLYLLLIFMSQEVVSRKVLGFVVALQCFNLLFFFLFIWDNAAQYQQQGFSLQTFWAMFSYFLFASYTNIGRTILVWILDPAPTVPMIIGPLIAVAGILVALSIFTVIRSARYRHLVIFGWVQYLLFTALIAIARHSFLPQQSLSSRYIYHILPGVLFVVCGLYLFLVERFPRGRAAFPLALVLPWVLFWRQANGDLESKKAWTERIHAGHYQVTRYGVERPQLTLTLTPLPGGVMEWGEMRDLYLWLDRNAVFRTSQQRQELAPHLQLTPEGFLPYIVR